MILALFSLSIAFLTFVILLGFIQKKIRPEAELAQRIKSINEINHTRAAKTQPKKLGDMPFFERVTMPLIHAFERYIKSFTPQELTAVLNHKIALAGKSRDWTAEELYAAMLLGMASMGVLLFALVWDAGYAFVQKLMFLILGSILGGLMPLAVLNSLIQKRKAAIQHQLPEVLDLLCVSVQAGLSFDASLRKIVDRMKGPFIEECRRMQDDIRMGIVRRTAMKNLASRCEVQDVSLFMTSLIQAERLGTSMGKTLKNQADNIRERRRQYVKAEALKAPVKIVFPLVLFIFPALFVVTLVPTLLFLMKNM